MFTFHLLGRWREISANHSLSQNMHKNGLGKTKSMSQELHLDLPCGTLGFSGWVVVHCLPRHINRRLDGKWDSQELKWCSDTAQWCCK